MRCLCFAVCVLSVASAFAADTLAIHAPRFEAAVTRGMLTKLDAGGSVLVKPGDGADLTGMMRVAGSHWAGEGAGDVAAVYPGKPATRIYSDLTGLQGSQLVNEYALADGELVVTQHGTSPEAGVHSVQWGLGDVPLECSIIVPGNGGIRLQRGSPGTSWGFEYPIGWEAQMVIIEGPQPPVGQTRRGFCVWAEDAEGRYKHLAIQKAAAGWRLAFATRNNAPCAPCKTAESVRWHVAPYEGDWRVPARRYREWALANWKLTPRGKQTPAWVKDIRFTVLVGQEIPVIEALAKRIDPKQTLLYVPGWRKFEYDRMYPNYEANDTFAAFVTRAHELGFRVMPHCNYFGCDPKSPEYATFEKYQARDPWTNERLWWLWDRADPIIKFAYISPACKAWRELQIARWKEVVAKYHVDALHLDQTLCIYNDNNGLIDGMTMLQGNIALQRELHEALPEVAISGEGLDEVTMRYEAFAQRHSHGLDFIGGTWDRAQLKMAHPISSYLLNPYTQPYGYLGMTSPVNGQLYAAWRENYKHWGVIPTFAWPTVQQLERPEGFAAQCLAEAEAFTKNRLNPAWDDAWPEGVCFPYAGTGGVKAAYRDDKGGTVFEVGGAEATRTVTGISEIAAPGSIPGWKVYDEARIFGLEPDIWYPYSTTPRDQKAFRVAALPAGFTISRMTKADSMAVIEVRDLGNVTRLTDLFDQATSGSQPFDGPAHEVKGELAGSDDGALFNPQGRDIFAHPPWRAERKNPQTGVLEANGTGIAYAIFPVTVPDVQGSCWFRCDVAMDQGAIGEGKTDGVLYSVTATGPDGQVAKNEFLNATATAQPLNLDLTPFRGKRISLRLQVHPGPKNSATFDWARWYGPRIEIERHETGEVGVIGVPDFAMAVGPAGDVALSRAGDRTILRGELPGSFILLKAPPATVTLPLDLAKTPFITTFLSAAGEVLTSPQYASAGPAELTVGGVKRLGLSTHPPDHGLTVVDYPMTLPAGAARFHVYVGLREGSKSDGCGFRVSVNGRQVAYQHKIPGAWSEISADLSPWSGKPIVLSLVTDSEGSFAFDWGAWGEVQVTGG